MPNRSRFGGKRMSAAERERRQQSRYAEIERAGLERLAKLRKQEAREQARFMPRSRSATSSDFHPTT